MDEQQRLYLRVVETGSLKAAAEEIGAHPSAVSRKIAALEHRLGTKLLQRSTVRSTATEAGERYYRGLRKLADEHAALEADVANLQDQPSGSLRISAPVDFGARFVAPLCADYQADFPELAIDLVLGSGFSDLAEAGIDCAVRIGKLSDSSLKSRRIAFVPRVLVASPNYLDEHGTPYDLADLRDHRFVFYKPRQRELDIAATMKGVGERVTVSGTIAVNGVSAVRSLVLAGRGIHLGPRWAFADNLASGELVEVLPDVEHIAFPCHVLFQPGTYVPAKIRQFIDRMAALAKKEPALID